MRLNLLSSHLRWSIHITGKARHLFQPALVAVDSKTFRSEPTKKGQKRKVASIGQMVLLITSITQSLRDFLPLQVTLPTRSLVQCTSPASRLPASFITRRNYKCCCWMSAGHISFRASERILGFLFVPLTWNHSMDCNVYQYHTSSTHTLHERVGSEAYNYH